MKKAKSKKDRGLHERIVFLADKELREWLEAESQTTGAPIGHIIRKSIEAYRESGAKR